MSFFWPWSSFTIRTCKHYLSAFKRFFVNQYETQFPQLFATLALSIAPVVVVYLFLQKQFIAGLTAGAVKA